MVVLVTGATGAVGSHLVRALVSAGHAVRALSREEHDNHDGVDWVVGDVSDRASLDAALAGCDAAYYLVHGLADAGDLDDVERDGARTFAAAAEAAGISRVVYLGGLAHGDDLSDHLRTRQEVGSILREEGPAAVELRASVVVGRDSASFELVRALVDNFPALVLPDWVETPCQPIALEDVVSYLVGALDAEPGVYEIGGADKVTYAELLEIYGDETGGARPALTLPVVPVPLPDLLARLAPERARVWLKLVEGMRFDSTVRDHSAAKEFDVRPRGVRDAVRAALAAPAPS
jgi:uncharacterized protein YbjT (DUF2867 family)